jgi:hypothetical protein
MYVKFELVDGVTIHLVNIESISMEVSSSDRIMKLFHIQPSGQDGIDGGSSPVVRIASIKQGAIHCPLQNTIADAAQEQEAAEITDMDTLPPPSSFGIPGPQSSFPSSLSQIAIQWFVEHRNSWCQHIHNSQNAAEMIICQAYAFPFCTYL